MRWSGRVVDGNGLVPSWWKERVGSMEVVGKGLVVE